MNEDYLWDGSGEPDPEIQRLETALGRFRHNQPAPKFLEKVGTEIPAVRRRYLHVPWLPQLAALAAMVLIAAVLWFTLWHRKPAPLESTGWEVASLAGTPHLGQETVSHPGETSRLITGQTLETDGRSRARITAPETGQIEVDPDTRLRLLKTALAQQRLALDRGTIHAFIWSPPGEFVVDTPSAVAVDLGCAYTLHVDDSGAGLLRTTMGWVGFRLGGHESFIPAGAICATRPGIGPGTPYYEDASESFRKALSIFDFEQGASEERGLELRTILSQSRKRDALTLWHLLSRVSDSDRGRVYDRLAALVPPPSGVTREGVLRLDQQMLDAWWNSLDLGDISLWRTWEHAWPQSNDSQK